MVILNFTLSLMKNNVSWLNENDNKKCPICRENVAKLDAARTTRRRDARDMPSLHLHNNVDGRKSKLIQKICLRSVSVQY